LMCNDNDPCTVDTCSANACHHDPLCPTGEFCTDGECIVPPLCLGTYCGNTVDSCFDLSSDPNNCGTCGTVCVEPTNICCNGICDNLGCRAPLPCLGVSQIHCIPGDPTCFSLRSDPSHCGSCGNACANGQTCSNGHCV
jgi:hypothetical protein